MSNGEVYFIVVLFAAVTILSTTSAGGEGNGTGLQPGVEERATKYVPVQVDPSGEWKEAFEVGVLQQEQPPPPLRRCGRCKCCATDDPKDCKKMRCCFAIRCNILRKPKGSCAPVPEACDCDICT